MSEKPQPGCLLIANPVLPDPNFSRTVVLLCEHTDAGSMGLILNRPSDYALSEALADLPRQHSQPLFWGGPVQPQVVLMLHRDLDDLAGGKAVAEGIALGGDREQLLQLLQQHDPEKHLRVFAGYSGWGAGQLAGEMQERSWLICAADANLVFETAPDEIWAAALRTLGPRYDYLTHVPINPRVN